MNAQEKIKEVMIARGLPDVSDLSEITHYLLNRAMDKVDHPNSWGESASLGGVSASWAGYHPLGYYLSKENYAQSQGEEPCENIKNTEGASYPLIQFLLEDFLFIEKSFNLKEILGDDEIIVSINYYISGSNNTLCVYIHTKKRTLKGFHQTHQSIVDCGWCDFSSNYSDEDIHILDVE